MTPAALERLEELLPAYDVESRHGTTVSASPEATYRLARRADLGESRLVRALFRLRGLPRSALTLEGMERLRFKPLIEEPPSLFVLGVIGRFWTPHGHLVDFQPDSFIHFAEEGYAKAIWSFDLTQSDGDTAVLRTVTRVHCLGDGARRRFRAYWALVGPFSGLIRRQLLQSIRRAAEREVAA